MYHNTVLNQNPAVSKALTSNKGRLVLCLVATFPITTRQFNRFYHQALEIESCLISLQQTFCLIE